MEFHEKLQEMRKSKGLTQEELAESLYVSRAAISKWESGRGYPNIDSLKSIAKFFAVSIDQLLSSDEILIIAEEDQKQKQTNFHDLIFALLDLSVAMFFFLPLFGQTVASQVQAVSLLRLEQIAAYLKTAYFLCTGSMIAIGLLTLVLQNYHGAFWVKHKRSISLLLNGVGALLFIVSSQTYAAVFMFVFLMIKVVMLLKKH